MLDEHAGSSVGALRHNGFLKGFGIKGSNKQIACVGNGEGQTAPSQTAMENCLQKNPDINVVYTINEPSAAGAWNAAEERRQEAERRHDRLGRRRLRGRPQRQGRVIDATSQQYPLKMASLGVAGGRHYAKTGKKASGLHRHRRQPDRQEGRGRRPLQERRLRPRQLLGLARASSYPRPGRLRSGRGGLRSGLGSLRFRAE